MKTIKILFVSSYILFVFSCGNNINDSKKCTESVQSVLALTKRMLPDHFQDFEPFEKLVQPIQ